jgi:hypothetical protein
MRVQRKKPLLAIFGGDSGRFVALPWIVARMSRSDMAVGERSL